MKTQYLSQSRRRRPLLIAGLSALALLLITTATIAALYNISTTDNSISEWSNQNIPVLQTDATGDTVNGGTSRDDIVSASVATGNDGKLYFLMKTNGSPAVNDSNHGAAVYIDCDRDGVTDEQDDRIITYIPHYSPFGIGAGSERTTLCEGNEAQCSALGPDAGQQVGSYIEWSVTISDLPANCQNDVDIKFTTVLTKFGSKATLLDETSLQGWNIPTPVTLKQMQGQTSALGQTLKLAAAGLAGLLLILIWQGKKRRA